MSKQQQSLFDDQPAEWALDAQSQRLVATQFPFRFPDPANFLQLPCSSGFSGPGFTEQHRPILTYDIAPISPLGSFAALSNTLSLALCTIGLLYESDEPASPDPGFACFRTGPALASLGGSIRLSGPPTHIPIRWSDRCGRDAFRQSIRPGLAGSPTQRRPGVICLATAGYPETRPGTVPGGTHGSFGRMVHFGSPDDARKPHHRSNLNPTRRSRGDLRGLGPIQLGQSRCRKTEFADGTRGHVLQRHLADRP